MTDQEAIYYIKLIGNRLKDDKINEAFERAMSALAIRDAEVKWFRNNKEEKLDEELANIAHDSPY